MAIVSVAIVLSFHLRKSASEIELRMARPLGAIFWILSVACLGVGMANYISAFLSPRPLPAPLLLTQPRHGQQVQPSRGVGADRVEDSRCMYIPWFRCRISTSNISSRSWQPLPSASSAHALRSSSSTSSTNAQTRARSQNVLCYPLISFNAPLPCVPSLFSPISQRSKSTGNSHVTQACTSKD